MPFVEDIWMTATRPLHLSEEEAAGATLPAAKRRNAMVEELREGAADRTASPGKKDSLGTERQPTLQSSGTTLGLNDE